MVMAKIRKGDKVVVITGRDKGRSGEVIEVRPAQERALVRGIHMVKRHRSSRRRRKAASSPRNPRCTCPIWRSPIRRTAKPTRVGFKLVGDKKVRFAKRSSETEWLTRKRRRPRPTRP